MASKVSLSIHLTLCSWRHQLRGLRCGANPRQAVDDLLGLADDIAHDLACRLDVADQAAGLSRPKRQVLEVAYVFRSGRQAGVFRDLHHLTGARSASYSRALARSLANRRLAGGLPFSNDGVAQYTMRRLLPANVEEILHVDGVFGDAAHDALFVEPWDEGFFARHETGAHRYTLSTQAEGGDQASTVGDASRGQHRDRRDGVDHCGHEHGQSRCAPHVTAGFDALGDHEVDAPGGGRSSLIDRPDLDRDLYTTRMGRANVASRIAPEENQEWDTRVETRLDGAVRDVFENEVDAKRPCGQCSHAPDEFA